MARRGRSRKEGPRKPCGRLNHVTPSDHGHELTLLQRASFIAGADARDQRAGYPLGILALRGALADPSHRDAAEQNHRRHQAGLIYAGLHAVVYGHRTPRSHLSSVLAEMAGSSKSEADRETIAQRCEQRLREAVTRLANLGRRPLQVLENIIVYEHRLRFMDTMSRRTPEAWDADQRDIEALRIALGALAALWKIERPEQMAA